MKYTLLYCSKDHAERIVTALRDLSPTDNFATAMVTADNYEVNYLRPEGIIFPAGEVSRFAWYALGYLNCLEDTSK